tara:strand:+ start:127 stop:867 length:741 start_codon:yes stop_codon:yes gene_type:complete
MSKKDLKKRDLKIYPLKSKDKINKERYKTLHPNLPHPWFSMCLNARSNWGKDVLISNLILRSDMLDLGNPKKPYIDFFVLISPTAYNDPSQEVLAEIADLVYTEFDPKIIMNLIKLAKENKDENEEDDEPFQILVYLNDLLNDKALSRAIDKLIVKARHYNINLIMSFQSLRHRTNSPIVRSNITHLICSKCTNTKQYKMMEEEYNGLYEGKFKEIYNQSTEGRYDFMYLDLKNQRAYKCFDEQLF